jgi:hypothetical protein
MLQEMLGGRSVSIWEPEARTIDIVTAAGFTINTPVFKGNNLIRFCHETFFVDGKTEAAINLSEQFPNVAPPFDLFAVEWGRQPGHPVKFTDHLGDCEADEFATLVSSYTTDGGGWITTIRWLAKVREFGIMMGSWGMGCEGESSWIEPRHGACGRRDTWALLWLKNRWI